MSETCVGAAASDEALMAAFRDGRQAALSLLFDRYASRIQAAILRLTSDGALARDITQTTFLSLVRGRARYVDGCRFRPWVYAIAMNALRDHMRRRKREVLVADGGALLEGESHVDRIRDLGLEARLRAALVQLPLEQRQAVVLHHVEGFAFAEIAEIAHCSRSAAKVRAHRGYRRLRELLEVGEEA